MLFLKKFWPAITWSVLILLLTGLPGSYFPSIETFWEWLSPDKLLHIGIFAIFSVLVLYGYREQYLLANKRYRLIILTLSIGIIFGLLTEVLQYYVFIGRHGSLFDFLADSLGVVVGCWAFDILFRKKINTKP